MYKDKHYGLTGQTVKVKLKNGDSPSFSWQGMTVPVLVVPRLDDLVSWANDIKEYALQQALSGTKYDGYKVVEG